MLFNILYYYYVLNNPTSIQSPKYEYNEKRYYDFVKEFLPDVFDNYNTEIENALFMENAKIKLDVFPEKTPKQYFAYLNEKYGDKS